MANPSSRSLIELQLENATLKHENEILTGKNDTLTSEITGWRNWCDKLKQSLIERDEQLSETVKQLNESKRRLSDARERLTVCREVTRATQIRELKQEGIYESLIQENMYETLRLDRGKEDFSAKPQPTETGWILIIFIYSNIMYYM